MALRAATLRARTTWLVVVVTGVTLAAAGLALVLTLRTQLDASDSAVDRARVAELLDLAATDRLPATIENVDPEGAAQVVASDGTVLAASSNLSGRPAVDPSAGFDGGLEERTLEAPDDDETETYRFWTATGSGPAGRLRVWVGTGTESVGESAARLQTSLLVGLPVVLLLVGLGTWVAVGRALQRVEDIRSSVAAIGEERLDRRVPESTVDDEVGRLATTMNDLLDRLESAGDRQRTLLADLSHDLRSPLTAQRALIEVAMADRDGPDRAMLRDLARNVDALEGVVDDLVYLSAADDRPAGAHPRLALVDLDDVVREEVVRLRATTSVTIDLAGVSAAPLLGDAGALRRLVRNLVDNAARHAATQVGVRCRADADQVVLEVVDDGPGVPAVDRVRVFERFVTVDAARTPGLSGHGLGLAIVRSVTELHGGHVAFVDPARGDGAHVVVRLPTGSEPRLPDTHA